VKSEEGLVSREARSWTGQGETRRAEGRKQGGAIAEVSGIGPDPVREIFSFILICAQVEATAKSGEVIFHFKDAPHPAKFGRARPSARRCRRLPSTRWAPPQRHMEQDHGPGMESFSAFFGTHLNATSYYIQSKQGGG